MGKNPSNPACHTAQKPQFGVWEKQIAKMPCDERTKDRHYINAVHRKIADQMEEQVG